MKNHPLFPEHSERDVEAIHVTRHEAGGVKWAAPKYSPENLTELPQILQLYGGGRYELVGHGIVPAAKGKPEHKGFCARQFYDLDGASKPLNPDAAGAPPVAPVVTGAPSGGSDTMALVSLMGTMMQSTMTMMGTIVAAALSEKKGGGDQATVAAITALGDVVRAQMTAPKTEAPAAGEPHLKTLMDFADYVAGVRSATQQIASKAAAGEDTSFDIEQLTKAGDAAVSLVERVKKLAKDPAVSPGVAAEELAKEAAAAGVAAA